MCDFLLRFLLFFGNVYFQAFHLWFQFKIPKTPSEKISNQSPLLWNLSESKIACQYKLHKNVTLYI